MKKVLIPVDGTKGSKAILSVFRNMVRPPEEIILLHVEKPGGKSMMYDMLGEAEMSTLKEMMEDTEYKSELDKKAVKILSFYRQELNQDGLINVKTIVRVGNPEEEILKVASEENVELMILGCNGKTRMQKMISGCVTRDVEKRAKVPVLVAKNGSCEKGVKECLGGEAYAAG